MFKPDEQDDEFLNAPVLAPVAQDPMAQDQAAAPTPQSADWNPMVKNHIMGLQDFSPEARQKLVEQSQVGGGDRALAALAAIGAGFQGRDAGAAGMSRLNASKQESQDKIKNFDAQKQAYVDNEKQKLVERERSPDSDESKIAQMAASKMGYKGDVSKITAEQFKNFSPAMEKIYQVEQNNQTRRDALNAKSLDRRDAREKKGQDDYDKYVQSKEREASSLRGDDAAKLSSAKLSAIASGRALLKQYEGREDEMTPDQLAILAADRVKAVTGGVPTNEEIKHMMPSNMGTMKSTAKAWWSGKPEPANSGGWVKEAEEDFKVQEKSARDILKNRQTQITSNSRLKPEDQDRIRKMAVPPELNSTSDGGGKIRVTDGKEVRLIDPSDLAHAEADGYKIVGGQVAGR